MQRLALLAVLVVAWGLAGAQDKIYRCGNEYVNEVPADALAGGRCKLLGGGKGLAGEKKRSSTQANAVKRDSGPTATKSVADAKRLYPELAGLDDNQVVDALHQTFYSDLPREKVAAALGVKPSVARAVGEGISANGSGSVKAPKQEPNWAAGDAFLASMQTPETPKSRTMGEAVSDNGLGAAAATERPASPGRDIVGSMVFFGLVAFGVLGYFRMRSLEKTTAPQSTSLPDDKIFGIHGWLRFFVISLGILGPTLSLGRAAGNFRGDEMLYSALASVPAWATYKTVVWLTLALFSAFSIYAALKLRFVWKPASVTLAKIAVVSWPVCSLAVGVAIPMVILGDQELSPDPKFAGSFLALIISTVVWLVYLSRSKCVRATYSGELIGTQPVEREVSEPLPAREQAPPVNSIAPQTRAVHVESTPRMETEDELSERGSDQPFDEDAIYETIAAELESGATDKGLWTRVFAECEGDEKRTRVLYIKQRAAKLVVAARALREQLSLQEAERRRKESLVVEEANIQWLEKKFMSGHPLSSDEVSDLALASKSGRDLATLCERSRGETLLHCCARFNLVEEVKVLLKNGADPLAQNGNGLKPFALAPPGDLRNLLIAAAD